MNTSQPQIISSSPNKQSIHFPDGNTAVSVTLPANASAAEALHMLNFQQPEALIMVIGGAGQLDDSFRDRLKTLCNLGIARVAAEAKAAIIDGGTRAGVMELIGRAVADRGNQSPLLGVAPSGTVTYPGGPTDNAQAQSAPLDPHHSHFVLVEGNDWGDETNMMYNIAGELGKNIPVVTILVNGGEIAKHEAWHSVQHGWPLIVIKGSGRMADTLASLWKKKQAQQQTASTGETDPELAEILEKGNLHLFPLDGPVEQFGQLLKRSLYQTPLLTHAWKLFAVYDENAKRQRTFFERLQFWILCAGVIATAFVVLQILLRSNNIMRVGSIADQIIHSIIVLLPIIISILLAGASRFTPGSRWVLLRAGAESIKREIYCYRTRTGEYQQDEVSLSRQSPPRHKSAISSQEKFAAKIAEISHRLMQTEINTAALRPYTGPIPPKMYGAEADDDGFSKLTSDRYIAIRIGDQRTYFRGRAQKLGVEITRYYWLIFIAGGVGTLLAALGVEPIVALTTAFAAAFASYLEYHQTQYTLVKYNQTLANLDNAESMWMSLSEERRKESFDEFVKTTEQILEAENVGWVQQMYDALASLRARQNKDTDHPSADARPHEERQVE
jgi:hypothetical protein